MRILKYTVLSLLLAVAGFAVNSVSAATTGELLQRGLYAEEVEGNLDAAIEAYNQIIKNSSAPPNHVAQALFRQASCYLKLKDETSARAALQKLVTGFPNQTEILEKARPLLDELMDFDPAALMPPGTLVYVELGSPGRQIEGALNSLKGTAFENPLAAMPPPPANGTKSPTDMLVAMLNPSMMAEFKKIRSSAFGVTGINGKNPSTVSVLYPGKSDALRGLIVAGLSMAGMPGEPIEGMQTVRFRDSNNPQEATAVAFDDRVIIAAQPGGQLAWSVKQYKQRTSEPSLATSNKSFAKLGRSQRENNALTLWANVDEIYAQVLRLFPPDRVPIELLKANAFLDLEHIDDLVVADSIEPGGLGSRMEFKFKEGFHSPAYDIVRTAPLNKAALQAVPAEAIAVASFSVDQKAAALVEKMGEASQALTMMGVGPEAIGDLQQITLFVMPAGAERVDVTSKLFVKEHIGLAISSRNPERTLRVLTTLLTAVSQGATGENSSEAGRFKVGNVEGRDIYCYLEQVNGNILFSGDRRLVDASIAALKNHQSICDSGALHGAVEKLTPTDCKLILLNLGGLIDAFAPRSIGSSPEETEQWKASLDKLARVFGVTTIQMRTEEHDDRLVINSSVNGIPPLDQLLHPTMQFVGLMNRAKSKSAWGEKRTEPAATVLSTAKAPVIDGKADDVWNTARKYSIDKVSYQKPASPADLSAEYRALWDAENLYLLVDVTDDVLKHDSTADKWYESDSIEVYIDADNAKAEKYGTNDYQFAFSWDKGSPSMQETKFNRTAGVQYAAVTTEKGWRLEAKFPWSTLGAKAGVGRKIGFDVHVNDNDSGGKRDSKLSWRDTKDDAWESPRVFGDAELAGLVGWWKFDETTGTSAVDSSGGHHSGTLVGKAKWAKGRIGGAIDLDGAGSYVRIADKSAFDFGNEATIAAWVNLRSVPSQYTAFIAKGDTAWRLSTWQGETRFHFAVNDFQKFGQDMFVNASDTVNTGEWHHVTGVYGGGKMSLFVDGKLSQSKAWDGPMGRNNFELYIGENAETKNCFVDGLIDDVRIYNCALSESQIKALAAGQ